MGGGDVEGSSNACDAENLPEGRPVPHFVLLLQEAHRAAPTSRLTSPTDAPVPRAIVEHRAERLRRDITASSERTGFTCSTPPQCVSTGAMEDGGT